ncbi:MAG: helix-turn-helix transcriptional regulator [Clostridia bacterium]|nr:helix-turn-helix transcriptional regulator [Clostridia bacterium]
MKYYQRLRDLREDHDLTQKEIALLLKTTQPQYVRYETGERELPMHHFMTLATFYNISLDYLSGLVNTPRRPDGTPYSITKKK